MATIRQVEVFSAGCPVCEQTIALVHELTCPSCNVTVHNMHEPAAAQRAKELGVTSVPAVAIDGKLASCCHNRGVDKAALQEAGVGKPMS